MKVWTGNLPSMAGASFFGIHYFPIFLVLILVLLIKLNLVLSLLIVLLLLWLWAFWQKGWRGKDIWTLVSKSFSFNTVFLVLGVMIFKDTLIKSGAVGELSTFFTS